MIARFTAAYRTGSISPEEVTIRFLSEIRETNPTLRAFLTLTEEKALKAARESTLRYQSNRPLSPLDGIPFALKDNLCTAGIATSAGSQMLKQYIPPYHASVTQILLGGGGVLLGKTNMDEFGFGNTGWNSAFGATLNPLDPEKIVGGSSSGSAAAVAAGLCAFALGSDTGGSVRLPAACCGIYGLKPTYGAISRHGLIAFASSMDTVGILTASLDDCRIVFSELARPDSRDATMLPAPVKPRRLSDHPTIGVLEDLLSLSSPEVCQKIDRAVSGLEKQDATVVTIKIPMLDKALRAYYTLSSAEAASNLARYDGIRYGTRGEGACTDDIFRAARTLFGDEAKRRILGGTLALSADGFREEYLSACAVKETLKQELQTVLSRCDLLICPVCPRMPWKTTETARYEDDLCTVFASLSGLPALSLPWDGGSVQLIGNNFDEMLLLDAAEMLSKEA